MSTQRTRPIDRDTAERLLDGGSAHASTAPAPLAALLAAATTAARPGELAGEQSALAGFRAARLASSPRPRRLSMIRSAMLRVLTVKAAIVAIAVTGAGGVALAATTGTLPDLLKPSGPAASATPAPSRPDATHPPKPRDERNPGDPRGTGGPDGKGGPGASHTPSPSLVGLCRAYAAGHKSERGKALDNPAFTVLITEAGGRDKVPAYCAKLLASAAADDSAPGGARRTGRPTDPPGRGADNRPEGKPDSPPGR